MQFRTEPTLSHYDHINNSTDPFFNHPTTSTMMIKVDDYYYDYDHDPVEYDLLHSHECKSPLALSSPPSFSLLLCFFFFFFFSTVSFSIFRYYFNKLAWTPVDEQQPATAAEIEAHAIVGRLSVTGKFMIIEWFSLVLFIQSISISRSRRNLSL